MTPLAAGVLVSLLPLRGIAIPVLGVAWCGALAHVVVSWRTRKETPVARTLIDVSAVIVLILLAPCLLGAVTSLFGE
jgi:hypothetical protein